MVIAFGLDRFSKSESKSNKEKLEKKFLLLNHVLFLQAKILEKLEKHEQK